MCVKQFFGYSCGHCSIPTLIQCPLASSNPFFPTCSYPAERPVFTGMYCHPCFRIVWNSRVLRDEEDHRDRHLKGECLCEVRFEGEDRERHLRERAAAATGKAHESVHHGARQATAANINRIGELGQAFVQQHWQQQFQQLAPVSEIDYARYFQQQGIQMTDPNQSYAMAVSAQNLQGQLMMGEAGSGMKWHPYPSPLPQPSRPRHKTPRAQKTTGVKLARKSNPIVSEPGPSVQDAESPVSGPADEEGEPQQPMVVSSSTMGLGLA